MSSAPRVSTDESRRSRALRPRAPVDGDHLLILGILLVSSFVVHAAAWAGLGLLPPLASLFRRPPDRVELQVIEVAPEEPQAAVEPEAEPALPEPEPIAPPPPRLHRERTPEPPQPPPAPAPEAIADFTGETLTNDSGEGFSVHAGNGQEMTGPIGPPNSAVTGRNRTGVSGGAVGGTGTDPDALVSESDLSRQPGAPASLGAILQRNYPRRQQELGVEGNALVRLRVNRDGHAQPLSIVSETEAGFGDACMRTLRESPRFDPPLNQSGEAVNSVVRFRCTFAIRAF